MVVSTLDSEVNLQHAQVLTVYSNLLQTVTLLWDFAATVMMEDTNACNPQPAEKGVFGLSALKAQEGRELADAPLENIPSPVLVN